MHSTGLAGPILISSLVAATLGAITGQKRCNNLIREAFRITGIRNDRNPIDTYSITPLDGRTISSTTFGWASIGFGNTMADSHMVVVWPNGDGSLTLSNRAPTGHRLPPVEDAPPRTASLVANSTLSNSSLSSITFSIPSDSSTTFPMIWAYSSENPGNSESSASFKRHSTFGSLKFDLSQPFDSTLSNGTSTVEDSSFEGKRKMVIAHTVCGGLATTIFIPVAVNVPRYARGMSRKRWWFPIHTVINGILAFGLVLTAFEIAITNFQKGFTSPHRGLGLTMFMLMCGQVILGISVHWVKVKRHKWLADSGRGPSNFIHMYLGVCIMIIGWLTTYTGIENEWEKWSGDGKPPGAFKILWIVLIVVFGSAYLYGLLVYLPKQLRMEREARRAKSVFIPVEEDKTWTQRYKLISKKKGMQENTILRDKYGY